MKILQYFICIVILLLLNYIECQGINTEEGVNDEPYGLPIKMNIILIGLNSDGNFNFQLDSNYFRNLLQESYRIHRPSSIERSKYLKPLDNHYTDGDDLNPNSYQFTSKSKEFKPLLIHNDITYNVRHLPSSSVTLLESTIQYNLKLKENKNIYNLSIETVESLLESQLKENSIDLTEFSIILINPNKDRVFGLKDGEMQSNYQYNYIFNDQICGPTWISSSRFLVVDMAAAPLSYGSTIHKSSEEVLTEGKVGKDSIPRLIEYFMKDGYVGTSLQGETQTELMAHMASLVIDSIQYVFCFDSRYDYIPIFKKVMVTILIFKDHFEEESAQSKSINIDIIKKEATRLYPFSNVSVVIGEHSIHDHKHIALALSKSVRSHTSFELDPVSNQFIASTKSYVDSKELLAHLATEDDVLAEGLIGSNASSPLPYTQERYTRNLQKTKILPVYVFSLNSQPDLFIDKYNVYTANQDAVVVIQSPITNRGYSNIFYYDNSTVKIDTSKLDRFIVAGLAQSQGVLGPTLRFSEEHYRLVSNYMWSFGQHPFGYFGTSSQLSQIFIDGVIRNTIITTIQAADHDLTRAFSMVQQFATKYLINSFGYDIDEVPPGNFLIDRLYHRPPAKIPLLKDMITRIHNDLEEIQIDIHKALTVDYKTKSRSQISVQLLLLSYKANGYLEFVENELRNSESQLLCCAIKSTPTPIIEDSRSNYIKLSFAILILFAIISCICRFK